MKKIIKIVALALVASMAIPFTACSSKTQMLKDSTKMVMATNAEFEPFEFMDGNDIVGIDVDIANQIATDMGVELSISNMNFDSVVTSVQTGKADVGIAGITKNDEREEQVDFSDPYFDAGQVILVKSDNSTVNSKDDLNGKKVSVQKGTTGDDTAVEVVGEDNVVRFNATTDAANELKNGKVEAMIIDNYTAAALLAKNPELKQVGDPLTSEEYCIAVGKGNKELLDKINASIKKMKDNGDIDKIVANY